MDLAFADPSFSILWQQPRSCCAHGRPLTHCAVSCCLAECVCCPYCTSSQPGLSLSWCACFANACWRECWKFVHVWHSQAPRITSTAGCQRTSIYVCVICTCYSHFVEGAAAIRPWVIVGSEPAVPVADIDVECGQGATVKAHNKLKSK